LNADPNKFAQIIRNLISNALKFTHRDGTISVAISVDRNVDRKAIIQTRTTSKSTSDEHGFPMMLVLSVTDSGAGISKVCNFT
jgi:signal transduction histidine kinase